MFRITPIALIACAAACNTAPGLDGLQGKWGGPGISVTVGPSQTRFVFHCNQAITSQPLVPDGDGRFSVVATLYSFGPDEQVTINGRVAAGSMQLDFATVPDPEAPGKVHFEARLGVPSNVDPSLARAC